LNDSEPLSETGAAAELLADAALLLALLAGALAAADELLLDAEEQAVSAASAPAVTARPAAIFLFIRDLLVLIPGREVLINVAIPLARCSRGNCLTSVNWMLLALTRNVCLRYGACQDTRIGSF
jgi:hypothetical protein